MTDCEQKRTRRTLLDDESGATAVEYAIILLMVALAIVIYMPTFQTRLLAMFHGLVPFL